MTERFDEEMARRVDEYVERLFVPRDDGLEHALADAEAAGLPLIHVSPTLGKLLHLIARMSGAERVLEIGTLGGYSTTWLARALPAGGRLVSLELDEAHATVARRTVARCRVAHLVELRVGRASDSLRAMVAAGEAPFDVVFIDADKEGYVEYLELSLQLSHAGTVILADNVIRGGLVLEEAVSDSRARGARAFNEALAAHPRLDSLILPVIRERLDGLSISIVK